MTAPGVAGRPGDSGAVGPMMLLAAAALLCGGLVAVFAVTDMGVTAARARTAADAAALAGMAASPLVEGGTDARRQARALAAANGAVLIDVDPQGWPLRYGVTVSVRPRGRLVRKLVPSVRATAYAAARPRWHDPVDAQAR